MVRRLPMAPSSVGDVPLRFSWSTYNPTKLHRLTKLHRSLHTQVPHGCGARLECPLQPVEIRGSINTGVGATAHRFARSEPVTVVTITTL